MNESELQKTVCDFIRLSWPQVIFRSDTSGVNAHIVQQGINKRLNSDRAFPDLQLLEPRGNYFGLLIELKRDGATVYLKDGSLSTNEHIQEQAAMIARLNALGYYATFAVGFSEARKEIIEYMAMRKTP